MRRERCHVTALQSDDTCCFYTFFLVFDLNFSSLVRVVLILLIFIFTVIIFIINITATVVSYNKKAKDPF